MFRIVASDLDGTLLSPSHTLTRYTKETLRMLTNIGVHFVFATGRHHIDVEQIQNNLDTRSYMITSNGARVHDENRTLIMSYDIDRNIAFDLFNVVYQDPEILTNVFRNDEWFINRNYIAEQENFFLGSTFKHQIYQKNQLPTDGICKVYFTSKNRIRLKALENFLNSRWGNKINVRFSFPECLEVMAGGVSKGHALKKVASLLGYQLSDCISFGDGMNDQEMLAMSGKGCIMGNAHCRLKEQLPDLEVIGHNGEEAVSKYLRMIFLEKKFFRNR